METINSYDAWIGHDLYDVNGEKVGTIDAIYYDHNTQRPEWLAITTGFFGTNTTFAPISGATTHEDGLRVPYTKDHVKDAPNVDPATGGLLPEDELVLFDHYGFAYDARGYGDDERFDRDYTVDTERIATGEARLRKYAVTRQAEVR